MAYKKFSRSLLNKTLDKHERSLGQLKNVVGMGIIDLEDEEKIAKKSESAIAVYVRKKIPKEKLIQDEVIPEHLEIKFRGKVTKVPTKVIEQGDVSLESPESDSTEPIGKEPL